MKYEQKKWGGKGAFWRIIPYVYTYVYTHVHTRVPHVCMCIHVCVCVYMDSLLAKRQHSQYAECKAFWDGGCRACFNHPKQVHTQYNSQVQLDGCQTPGSVTIRGPCFMVQSDQSKRGFHYVLRSTRAQHTMSAALG